MSRHVDWCSRLSLVGEGPAPARSDARDGRKRCLAGRMVAAALLLAPVWLAGWPAAGASAREALAPEGSAEKPTVVQDGIQPPSQVDIEPGARDPEIARRLRDILDATDWFAAPRVAVRDGVVFLAGTTDREQYRDWAADLARRTEDVVAVVNRIEVREQPAWDLAPVAEELTRLGRLTLTALPYLLVAGLILSLAWWAARGFTWLARLLLARRVRALLLRDVLARIAGLALFLLGLYIVLRISGLTRLAVTVLGGTGLLGLIIGIAFRDITENFLASILLSTQRPFQSGDLVDINGIDGYVQRLTTRATSLMTLDGNHVEIPNATVYKSPIHNFTSNPNRRVSFGVGIGYDDAIAEAQAVALQVLAEHPAVLSHPEPQVLADGLGPSTVNLVVYFWLDGREHSWLKVKSALIRLVKRAFQNHGISMPSDVREVVFPRGVQVRFEEQKGERQLERAAEAKRSVTESSAPATGAEAGLASEACVLEDQAARSRRPDEGQDLLKTDRET
jgi:small-conductance mechanosensitive channel